MIQSKAEWWAYLNRFEKASVMANAGICKELFEVFGPFRISHETFEGVEALPDPECHISWTVYEAR